MILSLKQLIFDGLFAIHDLVKFVVEVHLAYPLVVFDVWNGRCANNLRLLVCHAPHKTPILLLILLPCAIYETVLAHVRPQIFLIMIVQKGDIISVFQVADEFLATKLEYLLQVKYRLLFLTIFGRFLSQGLFRLFIIDNLRFRENWQRK